MEWFVIGLVAGICLTSVVSVMRSSSKAGRMEQQKNFTNGDYIRSLSDEELAVKIPTCPKDDIDCMKIRSCYECILKWLQQEREAIKNEKR